MIEAAPFRIQKCLNDNGSEFTDHFLVKAPQPMGIPRSIRPAPSTPLEHCLIPPPPPQTNGRHRPQLSFTNKGSPSHGT